MFPKPVVVENNCVLDIYPTFPKPTIVDVVLGCTILLIP